MPRFSTLGIHPSFGFGDRIGLATPGHIEAMRRAGAGIAPIFAQQSIREMTRTGRTPQQVIDCAAAGMRFGHWTTPSGADADHLKTCGDVDVTSAAGFTFFTIDPSDHVDPIADDYAEPLLREKFASVKSEIDWSDQYHNLRVPLPSGRSFTIDEQRLMRCAVKYGRAITHALALAEYIRDVSRAAGQPFELELSIDETRQPTSLAEHYIIADQFRRRSLKLVSIAPKFLGDFEKGVDYKGDLDDLHSSLSDHAALAREMGPYKLSLHSGSDKLSLYPLLARATRGCFHVKTAGTSYLEALRVVARHDEALFRRIIELARRHYERDRATYHVSARVETLPPADTSASILELEQAYLGRWSDVPTGQGFTEPGRQVLHCTFGAVLMDSQMGACIRRILETHADTYREVLADHFARHLGALQRGL
jgi:hypothetical protein